LNICHFWVFLLVFKVKKTMILVVWGERVYVPFGSKFLKYLTRNYKVKILSKSNVLYTIGKPSKHICLKWSCIFNLKLWAKSYDEKKSQVQISPGEKGKFDLRLFFHHNFNLVPLNWECKIILDIYVLRAFQWHKEHLIWKNFNPCKFLSNIKGTCSLGEHSTFLPTGT
jgi:hypothetical protein